MFFNWFVCVHQFLLRHESQYYSHKTFLFYCLEVTKSLHEMDWLITLLHCESIQTIDVRILLKKYLQIDNLRYTRKATMAIYLQL